MEVTQRLTNVDRCVGVSAAGHIARRFGDAGLPQGTLTLRHKGAAGHFYAAYSVKGMEFYMQGLVADSCFTAAYGGKVVVFARKRKCLCPHPCGQHVRVRRWRQSSLHSRPRRQSFRHLPAEEP